MQTSPKSRGRLQTIKAAMRGWFIKIGLAPPPDKSYNNEKKLSSEQEQAQVDLRMHQQRKPRYW